MLGQLRKTGWRPGRTLVLCSWDAEEFGLPGSTEWAQVCVCVCVCVCVRVRACVQCNFILRKLQFKSQLNVGSVKNTLLYDFM